jgi:hypothetical protein
MSGISLIERHAPFNGLREFRALSQQGDCTIFEMRLSSEFVTEELLVFIERYFERCHRDDAPKIRLI